MMNDRRFNNIISEVLSEQLQRKLVKEQVRQIVTEEVTNYVKSVLYEDKDADEKRNSVMTMLRDEKYDHAALAYAIWPDMDKDTARSLFSKCVSGKKDNNGVVRHFSDEDINKLYEILRSH